MDPNPMKVSVIVPVYNAENTLRCCVENILNQSYKNLELILVDDGSVDRSGLICDEYAGKFKNVQVIHKENGGVSSARNTGLVNAGGEYICFCDSDDYYNVEFIEKMVLALEHAELPLCTLVKFNEEQGKLADESVLIVKKNLPPTNNTLCAVRGIFRRQTIIEHLLSFSQGRRTGEDQEFLYKYMIYCNSFCYVEDAIYYYCIHAESTMHKLDYSHFDAVEAMIETWHYAQENASEEIAKQYYSDLICVNAVRTLEFCMLTLLTAGERPKDILAYVYDHSYESLISEAMMWAGHYTSAFYRLWLVSPELCLFLFSIRKKVGRLLRKGGLR